MVHTGIKHRIITDYLKGYIGHDTGDGSQDIAHRVDHQDLMWETDARNERGP